MEHKVDSIYQKMYKEINFIDPVQHRTHTTNSEFLIMLLLLGILLSFDVTGRILCFYFCFSKHFITLIRKQKLFITISSLSISGLFFFFLHGKTASLISTWLSIFILLTTFRRSSDIDTMTEFETVGWVAVWWMAEGCGEFWFEIIKNDKSAICYGWFFINFTEKLNSTWIL